MTTIDRINYMDKFRKCRTLVLHTGVFHADDLFVTAYCSLLREHLGLEPMNVLRVTKVASSYTLDNGYLVADIGCGEFDHHFPEHKKEKRENGVAYAAFGLVARAFHYNFLSDFEYQKLDEKFIQAIDYHDNNGTGNQLSLALSAFNVSWGDEKNKESVSDAFDNAVNICKEILRMQIKSVKSISRARDIAAKQFVTGHVVYMNDYAPVNEFYAGNPEIHFVGSNSLRNGYQIISVKDLTDTPKKLFPEQYRGYQGEPNKWGMTFCHPSGFMAAFVDKTHAMAFMKTVMEE